MTRLERRAAMPICTSFIDAMREEFPNLTVLYANENGVTWGDLQPEGVTAVVGKPQEKAMSK